MALDINNIKPAIEKAKNVATEQYVDSSIQDIDLSADLLYNNNKFASKLGYIGTGTTTPYEEMIADATAGKTIINGGRLNTELIEAGAINAGHIDAYAIAGKTITGGTINGTVINGVQINGAIIKGSFIDLTTSLALTNWQYYKPLTAPMIPVENIIITSWSYSGGIITCNVTPGTINNSSFIKVGNIVDISNLTSTTNPPNGTRTITEISASGNNFKFVVIDYPTGTPSVSGSSKVTSRHEDNFAHNNDGSLVVDSLGYVRLPGQQNFIVGNMIGSGTVFSGNLSNVTTYPSISINKIWDLHPWNSYKTNTLQRSIRSDTQFATATTLNFSADVICDDFDNTGTDTVNYLFAKYRVLDKDIDIFAQASNGNDHNSEIGQISFNGVVVAYADGRYGEQSGSDCASLDFNSNIKGLPINIKIVFNGGATIRFSSVVTIVNSSVITNHTLDDVISIDSVNWSLNTSNTSGVGYTTCSYSYNYGSVYVV